MIGTWQQVPMVTPLIFFTTSDHVQLSPKTTLPTPVAPAPPDTPEAGAGQGQKVMEEFNLGDAGGTSTQYNEASNSWHLH